MKKDTAKPHITELPIVRYPDQHITTNKIAISIPIFHSDIDSGTLTEFNADRIRDIHAKAAVWAAIALHNNTDLTQNGVGIFFHVEDTVHATVAEMLSKFAVPSNHIRTMTFPKTDTHIQHPHYGKKLMCLDDTGIDPDAWLIVDTDAFICSSQHRLAWYHKLLSQTHPSTMQAETEGGTAYNIWVYGVCLAVGLPFDPETDMFMQEQRAFYKLGFDYQSHDTPENQWTRPFIASQLTFIPTAHPICDFLRQHYLNCYQDEFLMAMWHMKHNDITPLDDIPLYYNASDYINRDKSHDTDGYLLHISDNTEDTDQYFPDFYDALHHSPHSPNGRCGFLTALETNDRPSKPNGRCSSYRAEEPISQKLRQTTSDKESDNGHRYGTFYDLIFDAIAKRQDNRKLRICEIGVSFFGEGSLKAFQELDNVAEVVGVDLLEYEGELAPHTTFHKVDNAYTHKTIHLLEKLHEPFDIIIDDGSHDPKDQEFFLKHYDKLLAPGGMLICEDIYGADFFKRMCDEGIAYGFDGWANLGHHHQKTDHHNERILIREKQPTETLPTKSDAVRLDNCTYSSEIFRFHLLGIAYGATRKDFSACAFVQKTRKGSNMLHKLGHEVYHYGHENSELDCTEHITVIDNFVLQKTYGTSDHNGAPDGYTVDDLAFTTFDINTERELRKRLQPGDFVLASFPHKRIYENIADLPVHFVEWGIGYPHTYADYRVYESNGWMHFHRGVEHATDIKSYNEPDWCCAVIPNYFDPDEFEYRADKEAYLLFLGRVDLCKGIEITLETSKQTGIPLVIAGQNFLGDELYQMMHCDAEYVGVVGSDDRRELLSKAMAVICPSMYLEPFLGVHIEAGFCGTPIITTNWGAPVEYCKHGITGYRCHSGEQFLWAVENIHKIDPQACLDWATQNFSMDRISLSYHEYFQTLHRNINGYFWDRNANRTHLNWLRTDMTAPEITTNLSEIQSLSEPGFAG